MKTLELILVGILIIGIFFFVYEKEMKPLDKVREQKIVQYKERVVKISDTITQIEVRLKKANEIHDTIEILKQQDTLIKFLKVEVKLQDTIIKKQDTIIFDCNKTLRKTKAKAVIGFGIGFGAGVLFGMTIKK